MTKIKHEDPETGDMIVEEAMGCAAAPCFPVQEDVDGMKVKIDCCDGHLCNKGRAFLTRLLTLNPDQNCIQFWPF